MKTLLIIDTQKDFCEGGRLAVQGGWKVAQRIEDFVVSRGGEYGRVVASRDFHVPGSDNGGHFVAEGEEPNFSTTWPPHCIQGTVGAQYAFDVAKMEQAVELQHVVKGMDEPAYSAAEGYWTFKDSQGETVVTAKPVQFGPEDELDVVGIATDYCVKATVLDALKAGARVRVLLPMVAGVAPMTEREALVEMEQAGAVLVD